MSLPPTFPDSPPWTGCLRSACDIALPGVDARVRSSERETLRRRRNGACAVCLAVRRLSRSWTLLVEKKNTHIRNVETDPSAMSADRQHTIACSEARITERQLDCLLRFFFSSLQTPLFVCASINAILYEYLRVLC